jgi:hypothetical protein
MSGVGPKHSGQADLTLLTLLSLDRILILDVFGVDAGTIHVPFSPLAMLLLQSCFLYSSMLRSALSAACREVGL